jgi:hypothetical protein
MNVSTGSSLGTDGRSDDDFDDVSTDEENVNNPQDGDDENHDLPTVEEYKTSMTFREHNEEGAPKSSAGLYTFLCLILLLIIVTSIAVPLALRNKGKGNSPDQASTGGGSTTGSGQGPAIMTGTPVSTPTRSPIRPPTMSDLPRKDQALAYLTNYGLADRAVLNDPTSPQAKALNWIADVDAFEIEIPTFSNGNSGVSYSTTRFAERWALAVFYYSTQGDKWKYKLNFLQPIDHCDWYESFVDPTGGIIRQGVTECQQFAPKFDGEKVSRIELCKFFVHYI